MLIQEGRVVHERTGYVARPQSISLGMFTDTKVNLMGIFIGTETASVELFSTYLPPEFGRFSNRGTNFYIPVL